MGDRRLFLLENYTQDRLNREGHSELIDSGKLHIISFMKGKNCIFVLYSLVFAVSIAVPAQTQEDYSAFPSQAIINASYRGDEEMVRAILAAGTDKNVRNTFGDTALHVAMFQTNLTVIKLLLDYGFDPNAKITKNGFTPLHNAVAANNLGAARLLLQYGANKNIKALNGQTPIDKARKEEKRDLIMLLYR